MTTVFPSLVSVIITVYNGERYLYEAINSILKQSFSDLELLLIDDGSTDRSLAICQEMAVDPRVRVLPTKHIGRIKALNWGWQSSHGEYIAILDADDIALPDRLTTQVHFLERHPEIGVLGSWCGLIVEDEQTEATLQRPISDSAIRQNLVKDNPIVNSSVLIRRSALERVGGYNEALPLSEDYELWVRLARDWQLANLAEVLTLKRKHSHAHFQAKRRQWAFHHTNARIRWLAWRTLSGGVAALPSVVQPYVRWLYWKLYLDVLQRKLSHY